MAHNGDVIDSGNIRMRFLRTTAETGGAYVEIEATYRAHSTPPPLHFHPRQQETFAVQEGLVRFVVNGTTTDVRAGEQIAVPMRAAHLAWNPEDVPARVVWRTQPALQTEAFFEALARLSTSGNVDANGRPGLLHVALLARRFADSWVLAGPPRVVQTCAFGLLAPLARVLGRRV